MLFGPLLEKARSALATKSPNPEVVSKAEAWFVSRGHRPKSSLYNCLLAEIERASGDARIERYGQIPGKSDSHPLLCISTPPAEKNFFLIAGFHGEEPAGPITIAAKLEELLDLADSLHVGLRIYPCVNPSGFDVGKRYNHENERYNNMFVQYELPDGTLKSEILPGDKYKSIKLAPMAKEARLLLHDVQKHPVPDAILDIHQDGQIHGDQFYAYMFGDKKPYLPIIDKARELATPAAGEIVSTQATDSEKMKLDQNGLVELNDGGITDYFFRSGTKHSVTLETTEDMSVEKSIEVGWIWIRGLLHVM